MIALYRTVITTETYLLAKRPEDAVYTLERAYPKGKSITRVVDVRAELVAEVRDDAKALYPGTSCYLINADIPAERSGWTCEQWASAAPADAATEADRLRAEANDCDLRAARLRAEAEDLAKVATRARGTEAAQEPEPSEANRVAAYLGALRETGPIGPECFGGSDYPDREP